MYSSSAKTSRATMESLRTGALTYSSFSPSLLPTAQLSSPFSGVKFLTCKTWNNAEEKLTKPMISQRLLQSRQHVGFAAHSWNGSEKVLVPEDPLFESSKSLLKTFQEKLDTFNRFTRPQIIVNKMLSIVSASLLAAENLSDISPLFAVGIGQVIICLWFMYIYIAGLNQLTDIEIDKVNKPDRPLVTGEYSFNTALLIVSSSAIMCFLVGWIVGSSPLLCSILAAFSIGTAYSINVPFLRWKRIPFAAACCMIGLQVVWPIGTYLHIQTFVLGRPALFSNPTLAIIAFLSIFAVAQTQFKDIPDIEGDKANGNLTLAVQFGAKKVFWSCIGLVQFAYLIVILASLASPNNWSKFIIVLSHMLLASMVWIHGKSIDLENKKAIESFYELTWKLISAEYILIHFIR